MAMKTLPQVNLHAFCHKNASYLSYDLWLWSYSATNIKKFTWNIARGPCLVCICSKNYKHMWYPKLISTSPSHCLLESQHLANLVSKCWHSQLADWQKKFMVEKDTQVQPDEKVGRILVIGLQSLPNVCPLVGWKW